jgi:hypothetical protein
MKYLNINQSLLKTSEKFDFDFCLYNDHKYNFMKIKNKPERLLVIQIFRKYLHDDIYIHWNITKYEIFTS